jgi:hypothetical protein
MSLATDINVSLAARLITDLDLTDPESRIATGISYALASGVGANQADVVWSDEVTLAASATADLDLAGVLLNALGGAATMVKLKAILVIAAAANTNNVNITRPGAAGVPLFLAASDGIPVLPGGCFLWVAPGLAGIAVTATTADLITFTNSAGSTSVTYKVVLIGTSA